MQAAAAMQAATKARAETAAARAGVAAGPFQEERAALRVAVCPAAVWRVAGAGPCRAPTAALRAAAASRAARAAARAAAAMRAAAMERAAWAAAVAAAATAPRRGQGGVPPAACGGEGGGGVRRHARWPRRRRDGRRVRRCARQGPVVPLVAVGKLRVDAAGAVGVRSAHLGAERAVDGADAVVAAARVVAAHAQPRAGGGYAVVARGEEREALGLVLVAPLVERGGRGCRQALTARDAVDDVVLDLAANVERVVRRAARRHGRGRKRRRRWWRWARGSIGRMRRLRGRRR